MFYVFVIEEKLHDNSKQAFNYMEVNSVCETVYMCQTLVLRREGEWSVPRVIRIGFYFKSMICIAVSFCRTKDSYYKRQLLAVRNKAVESSCIFP